MILPYSQQIGLSIVKKTPNDKTKDGLLLMQLGCENANKIFVVHSLVFLGAISSLPMLVEKVKVQRSAVIDSVASWFRSGYFHGVQGCGFLSFSLNDWAERKQRSCIGMQNLCWEERCSLWEKGCPKWCWIYPYPRVIPEMRHIHALWNSDGNSVYLFGLLPSLSTAQKAFLSASWSLFL